MTEGRLTREQYLKRKQEFYREFEKAAAEGEASAPDLPLSVRQAIEEGGTHGDV